jgi:hypothetical protein
VRLRIEYADQNDAFARFLPRAGRVLSQLSTTDGIADWFLVELDEPFDYQLARGAFPGRGWRVARITHFLVRSRWLGHKIGDADPPSVFIVIVEEGAAPLASPIALDKYLHVAWGMCHVEQDGP